MIECKGKMWQTAASAIDRNRGEIDRNVHCARATKDTLEHLSRSNEMYGSLLMRSIAIDVQSIAKPHWELSFNAHLLAYRN